MLCERCSVNKATVHLTRIINGKKEEFHMCEECARKSSQIYNEDKNLSFQSLLSGILNNNFSNQEQSFFQQENSEKLICNNCGMSYDEFTEKGLFGCGECFNAFEEKLDHLFKRIHGNNRHHGKKTHLFEEKLEIKSEINILKEKMQKAVNEEEFEQAAEIRDQIHAISKNMEEDTDAE